MNTSKKFQTSDLKLYVITDVMQNDDVVIEKISKAIEGGVTIVQLRAKNFAKDRVIFLGNKLRKLTLQVQVPLIINDYPELVNIIDADGCHVGQKDMAAIEVRKIIGNDKILGVSANTVEEAMKAVQGGADYIGAGPVFPTASKPDADPAIGIEGLSNIVRSVSIPIVAIGGIDLTNASKIMKTGVAGIAVISAIMSEKDPKIAAMKLLSIIKKY